MIAFGCNNHQLKCIQFKFESSPNWWSDDLLTLIIVDVKLDYTLLLKPYYDISKLATMLFP